jgi:uncharacterized zinc-type alcohol dehydrogenase-like protein
MAANEPLVAWEYSLPSTAPPPGYVDIAISHCGVCHSDVHQLADGWGAACWPLVAGHEIVGNIAAVGDDDATRAKFSVGDRALVGVQRGNCGDCACCSDKLEQLCPKITKTYAGPGKDKGGFADTIRYPTDWVFKAPESVASELLGPLMCAGITTYSPLKRHGRPGMKVGVVGIGGLGHVALQFASHMQFSHVVAISRTASKAEEAASFGATSFLSTEEDPEALAAAAGTFDLILNTASGHAPIDKYTALLKPRGTLACVGLPDKSEKTQLFLHGVVAQERSLVGSYLGPYDDYEEMLSFAARHACKPQIELFPPSQINEAVARVADGTARYRVVIDFTLASS